MSSHIITGTYPVPTVFTMSKIFTSLIAFTAGLTAVSALPSAYAELDARASTTTGNFSLFAFGSNSDTEIGGFPIFYHDGKIIPKISAISCANN